MHTHSIDPWQHDHVFGQERQRAGERRVLLVVILTALTMLAEIFGGVVFGSMALLADGLHMGSHLVALGAAWIAYRYARHHAGDRRFSFGTGKVNALAGYSSAIVLMVFAAVIAVQSIGRLLQPQPIDFDEALVVAVIGLVVNGVCAWLLADHDHDHDHNHGASHAHDHNLRAAYLHVLADMLTSLLAIAALVGGRFYGWLWLDAAVGIAGAVVISRWAWGLLRDTGATLVDREAGGRLIEELRRAIELDGDRVVDLHVWSIGPGGHAAAIAIVSETPAPPEHYKARIPADARIVHATVEVHRCPDH